MASVHRPVDEVIAEDIDRGDYVRRRVHSFIHSSSEIILLAPSPVSAPTSKSGGGIIARHPCLAQSIVNGRKCMINGNEYDVLTS